MTDKAATAMNVPQVQPWIGEEEAEAVLEPLRENWLTEGPRSHGLRERLLELFAAEHGCFAPNGTLALALGLLALDVGPGDEVLVPDTTFVASATSVHLVGATPVFAPVTGSNFQLDVSRCDGLVTERTKAVMPVHLYGMTADMDAVMAFARRHDLLVIEDAAQAVGVHYRGRHAGTIGDVGCFSFFADKTITMGEGAFVTARDPAIGDRLNLLRNQGRKNRGSFEHPEIGYNFRITDLQAAIGLKQLDRLPTIIANKQRIHARYVEGLSSVPGIEIPPVEPGSEHVPFRLVLLAADRDGLAERLEARGVQSRGFFYPLHKQPCFAHLRRPDGRPYTDPHLAAADYAESIHGNNHGLLLPLFPTMTEVQVEHVIACIREFNSA